MARAAALPKENPLSTPSKRDNLDLATTARKIADSAPAGTLEKAVAGSVAVTCATTRTIDEARSVLGGVIPEEVRQPALELLERLSAEPE
jgi:hypothetical protein